nr:hypothetical protein [Tanacetum cinerariifolium]
MKLSGMALGQQVQLLEFDRSGILPVELVIDLMELSGMALGPQLQLLEFDRSGILPVELVIDL